ncbi:MAG: hypothetical protein KDD69_03540 [Bdellovibrionales bacterium]|nr:hypothetical protein [Bdellovibrionales bacterium]
MMDLQTDLREFIELLLSKKVEFLVVGAHAVAFHGHPRLTGDIDFLIRLTPENAERLEQVCSAFGFSGPPFIASEFLKAGQTFQLGRQPNRIDILTSISGIATDEAWERKVRGKLASLEVFYISKPDLIQNKRATGRLKDLADADILSRR